MSKYQPLWEYISNKNSYPLKLSFEDISNILNFELDHSFLTSKKETTDYNFTVKKISIKEKFIIFDKQ